MPPRPTGNFFERHGGRYARVRFRGERPTFLLPTCTTAEAAHERAQLLAELAVRLGAAEHVHPDVARGILERAAQRDGKALAAVLEAADKLCRGEVRPVAASPRGPTIEELGWRWTSGELAREYPDHVRNKDSVDQDIYRLERYVYPVVGPVLVVDFTLDHGQAVIRTVPAERSSATRRHVAQLLSRLMGIAVFPLRLISASPLPRGFLPKVTTDKAKAWLYPSEDARLLASELVPLCWRLVYGFLDREGPRLSEIGLLDYSDIDLEHGAVVLDENKTDDPRAWALSPGVARALRSWRALRESQGAPVGPSDPVFVDEDGGRIHEARGIAEQFREHLRAAGVDRPILFEKSKSRLQIRAHDLRGTFVTLALANGKTEAWVQDRTGHKSSVMINRYRRAARTAAELRVGDLLPLDEAIPELAALATPPDDDDANQGGGSGTEGHRPGNTSSTTSRSGASPP